MYIILPLFSPIVALVLRCRNPLSPTFLFLSEGQQPLFPLRITLSLESASQKTLPVYWSSHTSVRHFLHHKATTWQMICHCPVPISLTADAHFSDRLGAFFYWTRCFGNTVPFDNITPIYLINLLWKLELGVGFHSELHYFSIFHGK